MFYAFILHIFSVALHLKLMYDVKGLENVSNCSVADAVWALWTALNCYKTFV